MPPVNLREQRGFDLNEINLVLDEIELELDSDVEFPAVQNIKAGADLFESSITELAQEPSPENSSAYRDRWIGAASMVLGTASAFLLPALTGSLAMSFAVVWGGVALALGGMAWGFRHLLNPKN